MTTLEPGASVVFTQGLAARPRSTAFLASSAAPIMTCGFDVFVHEVIAAMTTWPWSTSVSVPSSIVTRVGFEGRCAPVPETAVCGFPASPLPCAKGVTGAAPRDRPARRLVGLRLHAVGLLLLRNARLAVVSAGLVGLHVVAERLAERL